MNSNAYNEELKRAASQMIADDGFIIAQYPKIINGDGIASLAALPFLSLYCHEANECLGGNIIEFSKESTVKDLRNGLKLSGERFNKALAAISSIDDEQDRVFRGKSIFKWLLLVGSIKYNNLGVYVSPDNRIVFNTHLGGYYLRKTNLGIEEQSQKAFQIGYILGSSAVTLYSHSIVFQKHFETVTTSVGKYGYIDFNTNSKDKPFSVLREKDLALYLLYLTSMIGAHQFFFKDCFPANSSWRFRQSYIMGHFVWQGLHIILKHYSAKGVASELNLSELETIVNDGRYLFPSKLRNCMMHYGFIDRKGPVIDENKYNPDILLFGLIETIYDEMDAITYMEKLNQYFDEAGRYLNKLFNIDKTKVKWDL